MDSENIVKFLKSLGCRKIYTADKWVRSSCPLYFKHQSGHDENPSFGISIRSEGVSTYKCYTCSSGGPLMQLLWALSNRFGTDYTELMVFLNAHNSPSLKSTVNKIGDIKYFGSSVVKKPEKQEEIYLPRHIDDVTVRQLVSNLSGPPLDYLLGPKRGLTTNTISEWELGWSPERKRITIPLRDLNGKVVDLAGRALYPNMKPKFLNEKGFVKARHLFNEWKVKSILPKEGKIKGYLVEGQFDVIKLWQQGYKTVVSPMGSSLSKWQVDRLVDFFDSVTIIADGDEAGAKISKNWNQFLSKRLPTRVVELPPGKDPDELSLDTLIQLLGPPPNP